MISGIGFGSEHIAFTSRIILKASLSNCRMNSMPFAAVFTKSVSDGANGSKQIVTPLSSANLTDGTNVSLANSQACSKLTPGSRLRCLGEPTTIASPPRSAQNFTNSQK